MQIVEYAKAHPWATGIIVVIGGIVFIIIAGGFGGGGSSAQADTGPSDAEVMAGATIASAQISAQAQAAAAGAAVQAAQIGAGVQLASDKIAGEVAMENLRVSEALGLRQIDTDGSVSLATIAAQRDMYVINSNNQVATQNIIANASKSKNKSNNIAGVIGSIAGMAGMIFSDHRLKENVHIIGRTPDGIGVYGFNFKGSTTRHRGVIAQDVAKHRPDAVVTDQRTGFLKVNMMRLIGGPDTVSIA